MSPVVGRSTAAGARGKNRSRRRSSRRIEPPIDMRGVVDHGSAGMLGHFHAARVDLRKTVKTVAKLRRKRPPPGLFQAARTAAPAVRSAANSRPADRTRTSACRGRSDKHRFAARTNRLLCAARATESASRPTAARPMRRPRRSGARRCTARDRFAPQRRCLGHANRARFRRRAMWLRDRSASAAWATTARSTSK